MGNHHSASQHSPKPRKNVHWKSAGRPSVPGKPEVSPVSADEEPHAIRLRWRPGAHDGGAPLRGYRVECNREGAPDWLRTQPPVVAEPQLLLSGLEPPHRYRFRVAALNAVGRSAYSEESEAVAVAPEPAPHRPPAFLRRLEDRTVLENDNTEFRVAFTGAPPPAVAWFKDDYEIFSSRRTAICTDDVSSVLVLHQALPGDEGEIRCTATNRSGHAVTRARLHVQAAPKLRYPRHYEDGLLYEVNETIFLKTTIVGKPPPVVEWRHDGRPIEPDDRKQITNTPKFSILKIEIARRSDRGEYQVHARNSIGEDSAAFLVTVTAPPEPPRRVSVARQVDKSVTLAWQPPEDDGGCRIGNYVVEYYRAGWNVWLKATTSRKTSATLFDLIEGSEYRFRVKAESPYGMSAPSEESAPVCVPGRPGDAEPAPPPPRAARAPLTTQRNDEFMLVLYPDSMKTPSKAEKRESFQLDLDSLSPPPLSLSAPELSDRCIAPFGTMRNSVSSTELLHEHAMARFYKAVAMKEEQTERNERAKRDEEVARMERAMQQRNHHIPYNTSRDATNAVARQPPPERVDSRGVPPELQSEPMKPPQILIKSDSVEDQQYTYGERQDSQESVGSEHKWQHSSFEDDYTASTVSTDEEFSDEASLDGDRTDHYREEETYNPRDKMTRHSPIKESIEDEELSEQEVVRPLPLPNTNFIPKPILKKRDAVDVLSAPVSVPQKPSGKQILDEKLKKNTIFKKITKMPKQKSFPFPKILSKKESEKIKENERATEQETTVNKVELNKINEEGKTIIDYYGNILKEYGTPKKTAAPLYLNTEDLKSVAEKQQSELNTEPERTNKVTKVKKPSTSKTTSGRKSPANVNNPNSARKVPSKLRQSNAIKTESKVSSTNTTETDSSQKKSIQTVLLKKTERATIVIPIDYQELEKKAKLKVRSAIDYTVDVCLLGLAFWVYLFKDERLAVPVLALLVCRQLQQTILSHIPARFRLQAPAPARLHNKHS